MPKTSVQIYHDIANTAYRIHNIIFYPEKFANKTNQEIVVGNMQSLGQNCLEKKTKENDKAIKDCCQFFYIIVGFLEKTGQVQILDGLYKELDKGQSSLFSWLFNKNALQKDICGSVKNSCNEAKKNILPETLFAQTAFKKTDIDHDRLRANEELYVEDLITMFQDKSECYFDEEYQVFEEREPILKQGIVLQVV